VLQIVFLGSLLFLQRPLFPYTKKSPLCFFIGSLMCSVLCTKLILKSRVILVFSILPYFMLLFASLSLPNARFDVGVVHVGLVVDKVAPGQFFLRVLRVFPVRIIPWLLYIHLHLLLLLFTKRTDGRSQGTLTTQCCFVNRLAFHAKVLTLYGIQRDENAWK
jgi:hypothetical protein